MYSSIYKQSTLPLCVQAQAPEGPTVRHRVLIVRAVRTTQIVPTAPRAPRHYRILLQGLDRQLTLPEWESSEWAQQVSNPSALLHPELLYQLL